MLRGMIKWKPFYSLPGQDKIVEKLKEEKELVRIQISNHEEIDRNLKYALKFNKEVIIKFYDYSFIKTITGKVLKVDKFNKFLIVNNKRIYFKNILMIYLK